jgi:NADP-dependent 3-hydroxy acid dehydrogenase YdfG
MDRLTELAASIGARALPLDITDPDSVAAFAGALDRVDVLVNNAGAPSTPARWPRPTWTPGHAPYEVNVLGTVRVTKALLPALIASGAGDLLFVGLDRGAGQLRGRASYTAAKHGVHTLAETLRLELYDQPVRVVEIAPGW